MIRHNYNLDPGLHPEEYEDAAKAYAFLNRNFYSDWTKIKLGLIPAAAAPSRARPEAGLPFHGGHGMTSWTGQGHLSELN